MAEILKFVVCGLISGYVLLFEGMFNFIHNIQQCTLRFLNILNTESINFYHLKLNITLIFFANHGELYKLKLTLPVLTSHQKIFLRNIKIKFLTLLTVIEIYSTLKITSCSHLHNFI